MDDVAVFCSDPLSVHRLLCICDQFERASGAKVNRGKSEAMLFGNWTDQSYIPFTVRTGHLKVLGIWFGGAGACAKTWEERIRKMRQKLGRWEQRSLSIAGKNLVIRPQSVGQISESSLSRSGGLLTPRGSSIPSGRSTPRDTTMGSPSAGSGDSVSHRLASRTPTLLTGPAPGSGGQGSSERYRDTGVLLSHSVRHLPLAGYTSPFRLIGLNDSHRAPSVTSEPRRPIQLVPTPRNTTFRQPSIPPSRNAVA
ncbi:uncharacterized protein LOC132807140 [Hemiscyllium ocellatum]|uniref:uncharacterized protein LOC132807140 n=1 Tax=Hemiscyllium ocellatum TaxID=170820 RepID=UPI0029663CDA|nr:uncharacterized protein LOC132807140 [Hemiscyllium ocellatum]